MTVYVTPPPGFKLRRELPRTRQETTVHVSELRPSPNGGMRRSIRRRVRMTSPAENPALFVADLDACCTGEYLLRDGTTVKGQSFSHTVDTLRGGYQGSGTYWSLPTAWGVARDYFEAAGFRVVKGRAKFSYKNGYRAECDVVTRRV